MIGESVVVTGIGVCTPVAVGAAAFAAALRRGAPAVPEHGILRVADFDFVAQLQALALPEALSAAARQAARRAPVSVQFSLLTALEAWRDAGFLAGPGYAAEDVSVIVAGQNLSPGYADEMGQRYRSRLDFVPPSYALHFMDTDHVGVVSEVLGIRGEGFTTGGASASGNVGVIQGTRQIAAGRARACLVVGAMTDWSPLEMHSLRNMGAMAADGVCRPFDRDRHGFVYAQASASLVLESAAGARARGRPPLGAIRGAAQCLDGNRSSDPSRDGEVRVMRLAMADAGVGPADIDYVSTHGTGSVVGDAIEYDALREVFGERFPKVWLNSTKAITGHSVCAAGVVEAAGVLMQLREGFLHPTIGLEHPIGREGRFVGPTSVAADCRLALSNGFGFGGINTALVIERR